jgi:ribosomal-protein-alanine acetyltransferase
MDRSTHVRAAVPADIGAIMRIERDSPTASHWTETDYTRAIAQSDRLVLVSEESGKISGFLVASTATIEWELENIAVAPSGRRRGSGRALMAALIRRARQAGAGEIRQEIRASNLAAQRLGQSVGFLQTGRRKGYYGNPDEDALLFNYLVRVPKRRS